MKTIIFLLLSISATAQTTDSVHDYLVANCVQHHDIVVAQAILETGWFTSYGCTERHNLFAFRYGGEYLVFDTWQQSCDYYIQWQIRHYQGGDYYEFLTSVGYAEDPEYISKLKSIE